MTRVYAACVDAFDDESLFSKCFNLMDADRQRKTLEKKFPKDKKLSLGVGMLLYMAAREMMSENSIDADFERGVVGDFHFNLSHSGNMALCIISDHEVGCDIELRRENCLDIADRFFFNEEKELIDAQDGEEKKLEMFFRLWTLKESFMKATRLGFKLPLDEFCVLPSDGGVTIKQSVNDDDYTLHEYMDFEGYACAICERGARHTRPEIQVIQFDEIKI